MSNVPGQESHDPHPRSDKNPPCHSLRLSVSRQHDCIPFFKDSHHLRSVPCQVQWTRHPRISRNAGQCGAMANFGARFFGRGSLFGSPQTGMTPCPARTLPCSSANHVPVSSRAQLDAPPSTPTTHDLARGFDQCVAMANFLDAALGDFPSPPYPGSDPTSPSSSTTQAPMTSLAPPCPPPAI